MTRPRGRSGKTPSGTKVREHFIKLDYRLAAVRVIQTSPDQFKMTGAAACIEPASPTWP